MISEVFVLEATGIMNEINDNNEIEDRSWPKMSKKPYYITTAIAYTSGKPHIGNTYEIVLADSIARFKRL